MNSSYFAIRFLEGFNVDVICYCEFFDNQVGLFIEFGNGDIGLVLGLLLIWDSVLAPEVEGRFSSSGACRFFSCL